MGQLPDILQVANGGISALSRGHCDRSSDSPGLHGVWATVYHPDMPAISAVTDRGDVSWAEFMATRPCPAPMSASACQPGRWHRAINIDAGPHGGTGTGNLGGVKAQKEPQDGQPAFVEVLPPPLLVVIFVAGKDDKGEDV